MRLSADDKSFSFSINNANQATSPLIRWFGNFLGVCPVFDVGKAVWCRTSETQGSAFSACIEQDLAAGDEFLAAPAKPLIIQRSPFPESVQSAQNNKAEDRIQSNRPSHFHTRTLSEPARQYNRVASRKADRKNPYQDELLLVSGNSRKRLTWVDRLREVASFSRPIALLQRG